VLKTATTTTTTNPGRAATLSTAALHLNHNTIHGATRKQKSRTEPKAQWKTLVILNHNQQALHLARKTHGHPANTALNRREATGRKTFQAVAAATKATMVAANGEAVG
jgi:hypothetical protein